MIIQLTTDNRQRFEDEARALNFLNQGALLNLTGRPDFQAEWDENIQPVPTTADIDQALVDAEKARLKAIAIEEARKRTDQAAAADVLADIDAGTISDEGEVRTSAKYKQFAEKVL